MKEAKCRLSSRGSIPAPRSSCRRRATSIAAARRQEAVDEQVERDLAELVSVQQEAGLDLLADGMLRWQDIFRPFVEAAEGLATGALTRFLDTNTFYRAPSASTADAEARASRSASATSRRCQARGS